jgi:hypothetical protein
MALTTAKEAGRITRDVHFVNSSAHASTKRDRAFEIQLGTYFRDSLPADYTDQNGRKMNVRRYKNDGADGASSVYSATWDEWGWFIAGIFAADPDAVFGFYKGADDFNAKTNGKFADPGNFPPQGGTEDMINHDTIREQTGPGA